MTDPKEIAREVAARTGTDVAADLTRRCPRCHDLVKHDQESGYCGSDCEENDRLELKDAQLRFEVLKRDRGVCVDCGLDCLWLRRHLDEAIERAKATPAAANAWRVRLRQLDKDGFDEHAVTSGAPLWELDHVQEKAAGGPSSLANAVTRCLQDHKAKSARFQSKRADARRGPRRRVGR